MSSIQDSDEALKEPEIGQTEYKRLTAKFRCAPFSLWCLNKIPITANVLVEFYMNHVLNEGYG